MKSVFGLFGTILMFAVLVTASIPTASAQDTSVFRAGAAKLDITPPLGCSLAGHLVDRKATHVHDPLHARSLVMEDGKTKIAIVICDLIGIAQSEVSEAKRLISEQTGIPPECVLIAGTHTHTGPAPEPCLQSDPDPEYLKFLVVRIADSVRCAINNLRPARAGWGLGHEERMVFNRRYFMKPGTVPPDPWGRTEDQVKMNPGYENPNVVKPAGPVDPDLTILAVQDTDGYPIAVLGNYALHYVGGGNGLEISADYFGQWCRIMEQSWGKYDESKPPCVALLSNGCSGNINNVDIHQKLIQPHPYHQMNRVAQAVADEAMRVLGGITYRESIPLQGALETVELGIRKPSSTEVQEAQEILKKAGPELKDLPEIYARETVLMAEMPEKISTTVQAIRIGDAVIATFPGEAFVELGLEIKKKSQFERTFCVELANDDVGYIPTEEAYKLGGYETWRARSSPLQPGSAEKLLAAALALLNTVHESSGGR